MAKKTAKKKAAARSRAPRTPATVDAEPLLVAESVVVPQLIAPAQLLVEGVATASTRFTGGTTLQLATTARIWRATAGGYGHVTATPALPGPASIPIHRWNGLTGYLELTGLAPGTTYQLAAVHSASSAPPAGRAPDATGRFTTQPAAPATRFSFLLGSCNLNFVGSDSDDPFGTINALRAAATDS